MPTETSKRFLHWAAQLDQMRREMERLAAPVVDGGSADISFAASHRLGTITMQLGLNSRDLTRIAIEIG